MRKFKIRGCTEYIYASCMKQAILKLVSPDGDFVYKNHWYTRSNRKSWAEVKTDYGYECIVEEV